MRHGACGHPSRRGQEAAPQDEADLLALTESLAALFIIIALG
jgi:hypothetical protein